MLNVATDTQIYAQDRTARILVVEEEPSVAIMLDDELSDFGYHVLGPVENLKAAVYHAEIERIDAAVVDSNIDGRIAQAVTNKLMERGIPFVFVDCHTRISSSPYCAMPLLKRPFTADDLHRTIMQLLRQAA
jgi:DNA-binding response OmpR family regulator